MYLYLFVFLLGFFVSTLLITVWIISFKPIIQHREKLTPFECGFDPIGRARSPFSIRFFLLAVIFLVFDIEIVLLIPLPISIINLNPQIIITGIILFLLILLGGTIHEYREGSLDWVELAISRVLHRTSNLNILVRLHI